MIEPSRSSETISTISLGLLIGGLHLALRSISPEGRWSHSVGFGIVLAGLPL